MAVRKCKNRINGEICEYFVYGKNETPAWYNQDRPVHDGTYVIKDNSGNIHYFKLDISLIEKFEFMDEQPFADDESVGYIVPPSSGKRCIHRGTGIECDYFVWDIDAVPEWCDIVGGVGDYVVCDPEGMILCYSYENFNNNYKELDFELVEGWEKCVRYMDGRVFSYCVDGSSFIDRIIVRIGKGHDMVIDRNFFYMCFSVRGNFGEPIKEGVDYSVGVFGKDDGSVLGSAESPSDEYIDKSFAEFKFSVGKATYKQNHTGELIEFFIYDSRSKWYPEWFDKRKGEFPLPGNGDFVVKGYWNKPGLFDKGSFHDIFEVVEPSVISEYNIFEDESVVVNKCPVEGCAANGDVPALSEEQIKVNELAKSTEWGLGTGKGNLVSPTRFCRCKNDPSVIHEYFIYGFDHMPEWFKKEYPNEEKIKDVLHVVEKNRVVKRGDTGIIFIMSHKDFDKNLEVCSSEGVVSEIPVKYKIEDLLKKNGGSINVVDAAKELKINNANWKEEEEDIHGYIEVTFNTRVCKDEQGNEHIFFKKGDEIPIWFKLSGSNLKFYQDYIVYFGWLDFRSLTERKFNYSFKEVPGGEVTLRLPLYEEENLNIPKEIKDAKGWFNNLHPEVFRHIVLRSINEDGMVNMLKLYKSETK